MIPFRTITTHEKYTEKYQHWCSQSEYYAGGDHLISAFREGWELEDSPIYVKQYWKSGSRPISIYHFVLLRDDETIIMPVLHNPFVERYLTEQAISLVYDDIEQLTFVK